MLKRVLLLVAVLVAVFGGYFVGRNNISVAKAEATVTVPIDYGTFKGVYKSEYLIFEDGQGTIRIVGIGGDSRPLIVINRGAKQ